MATVVRASHIQPAFRLTLLTPLYVTSAIFSNSCTAAHQSLSHSHFYFHFTFNSISVTLHYTVAASLTSHHRTVSTFRLFNLSATLRRYSLYESQYFTILKTCSTFTRKVFEASLGVEISNFLSKHTPRISS